MHTKIELHKICFLLSVHEGATTSISRPQYRGITDAIKTILRQDGVRGLYQGVTPNVWGAGMSWGLYFFL